MGNLTQPHLTQFFLTRHSWQVPWQRIKMVPDGWFLNLSRLVCPGARACVYKAPYGGYQIHFARGLDREPIWDCILAHEITHIWQCERDPWFIGKYTLAALMGYEKNKFEIEARNIEKEFYYWLQNH